MGREGNEVITLGSKEPTSGEASPLTVCRAVLWCPKPASSVGTPECLGPGLAGTTVMGAPCRMAALGDWSFKWIPQDLGRDSQVDLLDRISLSGPVDIGAGNAWWRGQRTLLFIMIYLSFQYNWSTGSE